MKETHQTLEGTFVSGDLLWLKEQKLPSARLAQSVEHETLNLRVVGSSPTLGETFFSSSIRIFRFGSWSKKYSIKDMEF